MTFDVSFSYAAENDLLRLYDYLLEAAETLDDLRRPEMAMTAIRATVFSHLSVTPFSFRKTGRSSTRRELIIPFGSTGYVALYEIAGPSRVVVLAVRHQREQDYQ